MFAPPLHAQGFAGGDQGKLLLTGGGTQAEGAAGGGLAAWALITGYGTRDSYGANAHSTLVKTSDYRLHSYGVGVGINDRVELSLNRQDFKVTGGALNGVEAGQDIFGVKVKVLGDAVYGQDSLLPQVAVGVMHKRTDDITGGVLGAGIKATALGAKKDSGTDIYVAATKLLLSQSLLLNGTVRFTKANQFGLLGFGGDLKDEYRPEFEATVLYLFSRSFAVATEYRTKPRNLSADKEQDAWDMFFVWAPNKHFPLVGAYLNLGKILDSQGYTSKQKGPYVSVQVGF